MSLRAGAFTAATVLVFGAGVYLFHAVRETPAQADAPIGVVSPPPHVAVVADAAPPVEPPSLSPPPRGAAIPPVIVRDRVIGRTRIKAPDADAVPADDPRPGSDDPQRANPKADALMDQANKAYDNGEYDDATALAAKVLAKDPANIRMKRIMVSAACQSGDNAIAQKYYAELPLPDKNQMKTRCARFGVTFE